MKELMVMVGISDTSSNDTEHPEVGRSSGARTAEVAALMDEAVRQKKCPFCPEMFMRYNGEEVIDLSEYGQTPRYWNVWRNKSPFAGTQQHIMLAATSHVSDIDEISEDAWLELRELVLRLKRQFDYVSYSLLSRLGDPRFNSATVYHLHVHVVVSDGVTATESDVDQVYRSVIERVVADAPDVDDDLEWLGGLRDAIDVLVASRLGKATPIRAKLSSKVGNNSSG